MLGALSKWTVGVGGGNTNSSVTNSTITEDDDDDAELTQAALQALLNPDTRNALAEAFTDVGSSNGKLSIEQFIVVMKHFSLSGTDGGMGTGAGGAMADPSGNAGLMQLSVPALLFIRL